MPEPAPSLSRLERLLLSSDYDAGQGSLDDQCERVRRHLRAEVDQRLRATVPRTKMIERSCTECGQPYQVSERRAREQTRCEECRFPMPIAPTQEELAWAAAQPPEVRDAVMAFFSQFVP